MSMTQTTTTTDLSSGFLNDHFQEGTPAMSNILDGVSFWSKHTPNSHAICYPHDPKAVSFESVSWREYEQAIAQASKQLATELGLVVPAPQDPSQSVVTLLISPSHDNLCLWMALAGMGYTTQFISPAHVPSVIAHLIIKAQSSAVIHSGLDADWIRESKDAAKAMDSLQRSWVPLPASMSLNGLLERVRSGPPLQIEARAKDPHPFVMLHSFGSTSTPKLYPLGLESANISALDSAGWWIRTPSEHRWRCQLQTSLPFHFSFQNPVWRGLMCGTTVSYPVIRPSGKECKGQKLIPSASDVLDSLELSRSDLLYASPSGLENMLEVCTASGKLGWKQAVKRLKEAHTGGAPTSYEKADLFRRNGLMVMQVFATTEAGMLFVGKPNLTGHLCYLTPRPQLASKMLFSPDPTSPDTLQLWLPEDFPGLVKRDLTFEPFPSNPSIQAWNTSDTFRLIKSQPAQLFEFCGRTDDWLRLTVGTACRALEIESRFTEVMRSRVGWGRVKLVTALGNARKALSVMVELDGREDPSQKDRDAAQTAAETVTREQLQYPAVLKGDAVFFTNDAGSIHVTQKGTLQRKKNETSYAPFLDARDL